MSFDLIQPGTVLVVDDNPTNIQVLFDVLSGVGYRVAIAKSGAAALQKLQSYHPDIILLDVMMPGMDGFETCQHIKADPATQNIPVIFMTALSDPVDKVKGLSLGAVDYITKPVQHEEALARIRIHIQLSHTQRCLERSNNQLQAALEHLKQTQVQLIQSEKMSSLGQMLAGVAHEINNPVNFISSNLAPAEEYIQGLMRFVQLYHQVHREPHPEMQALMEEIDMDYLMEDLPNLMRSLRTGSDRIQKLVVSLRNFSRLDEEKYTMVNISEGIESTLLLLQHRLKSRPNHPGVQVVREYGELPLVECCPSQLNQVFMNIISNAVDALEERDRNLSYDQIKANPSVIRVSTAQENGVVKIQVSDNGTGVPSEVLEKLFEPFFTTKPVGKGTGLGLSISHQIITQKHQGEIACSPLPEGGTLFTIKIPIKQSCKSSGNQSVSLDSMTA
jgi:signal transduction histidine kinase